ncbi:hypothetical protein DWV16_01555 [Anaerotruncus sp. AF02-27]|uniref:TRAP transporter substrate-binding protein n=1 Tax=Anaerotruncus sp. AF02-27 TaxID=2292191 RepID=UPI000E500087|nr:TRAP transporter substrate-binding protein DctP [Anaerotruncus sp. AF02-27]RGX57029.1 hypothetical protein DWV16_01555 [Anaerotruncus sp. AF02-27]
MKKLLALILAAALALGFAACGSDSSAPAASGPVSSTFPAASGEKISLTFAAHFSNTIPLGEIVSKAKGLLEEASGGRITLDEYYNESLVKQADTFSSIGQGMVDIAYVPSQNLSDVEMAGIYKLLYPNGATDISTMTNIYRSALEKTQIQENLAKFNTYCLTVRAYGGKQLATNKMVTRPDDLKGMNIGANGNDAFFFTKMGAGAVTLANSDYYTSMSNGLVGGLTNHWVSMTNYGLNEVSKYFVEFGGGIEVSSESYLINLDKWNSLSPEDQQIVRSVFEQVSTEAMEYDRDQLDKSRQSITDEGIEIYTLTAEELAAFAPYAEEVNRDWIEEASAEGWDAQGAYDYIIGQIG